MAENGHYWQIEGESATAENIDIVLSDLTEIVEENVAEPNQDVVKFIPGTGGEKGHFELGEGAKAINAEENEIIVGDGNNWASGNTASIKLKAVQGITPSTTAMFHTDDEYINGYSFFFEATNNPCNANTETYFLNGTKVKIGEHPMQPYQEGVWEFVEYKGEDVNGTTLEMDRGAQILMKGKGITEIPTINMEGNSFIDFQWNDSKSYTDFQPGRPGQNSVREGVRRGADPFGLIKNNNYIDSNAPILQMHDASTLELFEKSVIQAKNHATAILQGNANVRVSGGEWTQGYHSGFYSSQTFNVTYNGTTTTIYVFCNGIILSKEMLLLFRKRDTLTRSEFQSLIQYLDIANEGFIDNVYIYYNGLTREDCLSNSIVINSQTFSVGCGLIGMSKMITLQWQTDYSTTRYVSFMLKDFSALDDTVFAFFLNIRATISDITDFFTYLDTKYGQDAWTNKINLSYYNANRFMFNYPNYLHVLHANRISYGSSAEGVSALNKTTEVDIGPNSQISVNSDVAEDTVAEITVHPQLIRLASGHCEPYYGYRYINPPITDGLFNYAGSRNGVTDLPYAIQKDLLLPDDSKTWRDFANSQITGPHFQIDGKAATHKITDSDSVIVDVKSTRSNSEICEVTQAQSSSFYGSVIEAGNGATVIKNETYLGNYIKDLSTKGNVNCIYDFKGDSTISFVAEDDNTLCGIYCGYKNIDITTHIETLQAIIAGKDNFIQWDGNNHFESWSGTQIFRASNPNLTIYNGSKYYPKFTNNSTGSSSKTKTIKVHKDISSYTNQQLADEFGSQLLLPKPNDAFNTVYDSATLSNSFTKTFLNNTYVQSIDIKRSPYADNISSYDVYISSPSVYVYSNTDYSTAAAALANSTIKELVGKALNIGGTWDYVSTPSYSHTSEGGRYKLRFYSRNIRISDGMKLLLPSKGTTMPNNFNLPADTAYWQMTDEQKALMEEAMHIAGNEVYDSNGQLVAWCNSGSFQRYTEILTADQTNYSAVQTGVEYDLTCTTIFNYHKTQHLDKNWFGPIQTADRIGQNPSDWEKGPITQMYGPVNFLMREKWTADNAHTKTYPFTSSETYDVSNQAQAIDDFINSQDYTGFQNELTTNNYTLWDILSISGSSGSYTITFSICEAGWKPHIDSYPDNPVVEITDGSELRLYGGVKVKGETKYGVTTFTFSGTQTEGEVSFTLDELRMLKTLVGSVRTAVVNDPSEAVELGTLYFIDEGGNA